MLRLSDFVTCKKNIIIRIGGLEDEMHTYIGLHLASHIFISHILKYDLQILQKCPFYDIKICQLKV